MMSWIVLLLLAFQSQGLEDEGEVHRLDLDVEVRPLKEGLWLYRSTNRDGFPANGLIAEIEGGLLLVDTAYTDEQTDVILSWAKDVLGRPVTEAISTHDHVDRVGGLGALHRNGVQAWAIDLTVEAVRKEESRPPAALFRAADGVHTDPRGFEVYYPGPGHVTDNVVAYFPDFPEALSSAFRRLPDQVEHGQGSGLHRGSRPRGLAGDRLPASVELAPADGSPHRHVDWRGTVADRFRLTEGSAVVPHLAAGTWTVVASSEDGRTWQGSVSVVPGATAAVELRCRR